MLKSILSAMKSGFDKPRFRHGPTGRKAKFEQLEERRLLAGEFTDLGLALTGVYNSSVAWGDYDNDGDLDILLTGEDSGGNAIAKVYRNDGSDTFTDVGASLTGVADSSVAWGDYDADGDLDILLTGNGSGFNRISKIYRNDGSDTFTDISASLTAVAYSSVAWGDYDNDGDLDILLTGRDSGWNYISKIYRNDGSDTFTDISAPLTGVSGSSGAWGDYDNDGDLDILLTGNGSGFNLVSKIYRNDGSDTFTDISASLTAVSGSSGAWGDYDNDGDLDILLTGYDGFNYISKVYRNDGSDTFTDISAPLTGVTDSSVAWGDYDNDGDLDILLTGRDSGYIPLSKVYRNDGSDTFTDISASLTAVAYSSVAWGDYDNDGDLDILLTGMDSGYTPLSKIYRNNSATANTAPTAPTGLNVAAGSSATEKVLSWTAATDTQTPTAGLAYNLYIGTSAGDDDVSPGMADLSGGGSDGLRRIAQIGPVQGTSRTITDLPNQDATYYWSVQAVDSGLAGSAWATEGNFVVVGGPPGVSSTTPTDDATGIDPAANLSITFNENVVKGTGNISIYDSSDTLIEAIDVTSGQVSILGATVTVNPANPLAFLTSYYVQIAATAIEDTTSNAFAGISDKTTWNFTTAKFTDLGLSLTGVSYGSLAWGDYDADGDLDILLTGRDSGSRISKVYRNDGSDTFTDVGASLAGVDWSAVAWGDYDADGDLDILLTGSAISKIYRNDGSDTFTDISAPLTGVGFSSVAWGDYDNDGDLDILLTGLALGFSRISKIYRNDGSDTFTDITDIDASLADVSSSSVAWGDYDNDGDLDILLTGLDAGNNPLSKIYRNDGSDTFTDVGASLTDVSSSSVAWGDYDNDGDLDILLTGRDSGNNPLSKIYRNDGSDTFTDVGASLTGVWFSSATWGDYDNDGDLDILLTGMDWSGNGIAKLYRNNIATANTAPAAPTGLNVAAGSSASEKILSWTAATDAETAQAGLSYNLYLGTTSGDDDISPGMADLSGGGSDGLRRIAEIGPSQSTSWTVDLPNVEDTYYWSVQAVDTALAGSAWAAEASFDVDWTAPTINSTTPADDATDVDPTADLSITFNENVVKGTGNISIYDSGDNLIEAIDVTTGQVAIAGATVTVNPTNPLADVTGYYVQIAATAVEDTTGNAFAGIADKTTWNFTTATDLGTVDYLALSALDVSGGLDYVLQTTHDGQLSLVVTNSPGGTTSLELLGASRTSLATHATRVDWDVLAGETYYLNLSGTATDVDLAVVNLLDDSTTDIVVHGTSADDTFVLTPNEISSSSGVGLDAAVAIDTYGVTINGVQYQVPSAQLTTITFDGGTGLDTANLTGTSGDDHAQLSPNAAVLTTDAFTATVTGTETIAIDAGAGTADAAEFNDSAGDDAFTGSIAGSTMIGTGYQNSVTGFEYTHAYARAGGVDVAELEDTAGDDRLEAHVAFGDGKVPMAKLTDSQESFVRVKFFEFVHAYAKAGGDDTARMFDSAANDKFRATPEFAKMYNSQYFVRAKFFETVTAYATAGGTDDVRMWDSTANDKLISTPTKVRLYNTTDNWDITARMFESATVLASAGKDTARLFGGDQKDVFRGRPNKSTFYGSGYDLTARRFDKVTVYGNGGLYDIAKLHDTAGDDHLATNATQATLARTNGTRTLYEANDFDTVRAYQSTGADTHTSAAATDYVLDLIGDWTPTFSRSPATNILPLANQDPESWLKRTYVAPR